MSVENFQVERVGKTVKIWFDSGADVEKNMLAFTHEFESEIEADLVMQQVNERIDERDQEVSIIASDYALREIAIREAVAIENHARRVYYEAARIILNGESF